MRMLCIIPARGGSVRIPNKNIKVFNGKPLIYYTIDHAKKSGLFDKIIVDTDSPEIARVAKKYGAEVPFLRPKELATSTAKVGDAVHFLLKRLEEEENYKPDAICLLQTTSPLREVGDILNCLKTMQENNAQSVCTVCETSPWFFNLHSGKIVLVNKDNNKSTNTQEVKKGFILNGCMVYMVKTSFFMKTRQFTDFKGEKTVGVICDKWRSVDLDNPDDWVIAEFLHKNYKKINEKIKKF